MESLIYPSPDMGTWLSKSDIISNEFKCKFLIKSKGTKSMPELIRNLSIDLKKTFQETVRHGSTETQSFEAMLMEALNFQKIYGLRLKDDLAKSLFWRNNAEFYRFDLSKKALEAQEDAVRREKDDCLGIPSYPAKYSCVTFEGLRGSRLAKYLLFRTETSLKIYPYEDNITIHDEDIYEIKNESMSVKLTPGSIITF